jgi:hypothetical protein
MFHSGIAKVTPAPYRVWYNANEDRKASIHGSCPWFDGSGEKNWTKIECGFTLKVEHKDGSVTYGLGRPPFASIEEANAAADRINAR